MLDPSRYTYQWEIYAGGAKQIAKRLYSHKQVYEGDALLVLNWLFFHDAMFKFSARHWRHTEPDVAACGGMSCAQDDQIMKMALLSGNPREVGIILA